ncbi:MAG: apolipoprotein N-acyltransferase [Bacteroidetes bacterium]|nr:apolipoprotein N-acyltransferase [Bacteroidota bacterium]
MRQLFWKNIGLSVLSALLFALPWRVPAAGWLLWFAFVPLLWLEADFRQRKERGCWIYYALTFLLWNVLTTYWIYRATLWGGVVAVVGNAFQMFLIFALFRWVKKKTTPPIGYIFLAALWIAWEYFYFDAEISWPWLVLGNGFGTTTFLVQWYEYTGVLGGSLWAFLANILILRLIKERKGIMITAVALVLPVLLSLYRYWSYAEKQNPIEVVVLQPNIDPYNDKFDNLTQEEQDSRLLEVAQRAVRPATRYIFAPETAVEGVLEEHAGQNASFTKFLQFLQEYPRAAFVVGAVSTRYYSPAPDPPTETAKRYGDGWYDRFNAAFQLSVGADPLVYHKSKLVIGAEKSPYMRYLKFANNLIIDLGGAMGSFGTQSESAVFPAPWNQNLQVGVAICYESVYGEYFASYVKKGAGFMAVITNDGWWGNTPGYRQHLAFSRLRAIETRRSIARSANTGISALINQRGDFLQKSAWWEGTYLRGDLNINHTLTFYVRHGDLIGRASVYALVLLLVYGLADQRGRRNKRTKA